MMLVMIFATSPVEAEDYDINQLKQLHSKIFYFYKKSVDFNIEQQLQRARTLIIDDQDVDLGAAVLDEILKHEKNAEGYLLRGIAYTKLKKFDVADKDYEQALLIEPTNPTFYYFRALNYFYRGYNNQAISTLEKALKYEEYYIDAIVSIGDVYNSKGEYAAKQNRINDAISNFEKAIQQYNKVLVLFPDNAIVLAKKEDTQNNIKLVNDKKDEQKRKQEIDKMVNG